MSITPLSLATGYADLEIYNGYQTFGFRFAPGANLSERRGDAFAGQVASGGQNYDDATPFKRKVYKSFLGGFGQLNDNKVSGGVGIGGDDTKFFYADAKTDRAGYLLPGPARNLVYNTYAASMLPVSGDQNPNAGDEYEVPRGVMPAALLSGGPVYQNSFTVGAAALNGVTNLRVLLALFDNTPATTVTLKADVYNGATLVRSFTTTYNPSTNSTINGWSWVTLSAAATNFLAATTYTVYFSVTNTPGTFVRPLGSIGCYALNPTIQARNSAPNTDWHTNIQIRPYFQICKPGTATPYKWMSSALKNAHQLLNGSTYINVAVLNSSWFNTGMTNGGGTNPNSPEVTFSGTYKSSIVWNNKLYVASSAGVTGWSAAQVAANVASTPTNPLDATFTMNSLINGYGKLYFVGAANNNGIIKWDGAFPVTGTTVVVAGTIGETTSPINRIFFYQGNLWAAKPEGLFCLYGDPATMGTVATNTPRILPMGDPFPMPHQAAGLFATVHQGSVYLNYKDRLYQYTSSATGTQVQIIPLPMPWYKLGNYHQIDGITSDGVNLYVSYNNLGVFSLINQTWHVVSEVYETISTEPTASGLTWVPSFASGPDSLYFRDGQGLVQLPMPSASSPFTRQVTLAEQNKCGYLVTSATNFEAAEMNKFILSMSLTCFMSSYCVLVRPVVYVPGTTDAYYPANFNTMLQQTFQQGLTRDRWIGPAPVTNNPANTPPLPSLVGTGPYTRDFSTHSISYVDSVGGDFVGSGPTWWTPYDFLTSNFSSEKNSYILNNFPVLGLPYDDLLQHPANLVQTAFVVYFFDPWAGQQQTVGQDIFAIDSLVVKYQTTQKYTAVYRFGLSMNALTEGRGSDMTQTEAEDVWEWLRVQFTRYAPLQITFKVRNVRDTNIGPTGLGNIIPNSETRTVLGFLQNPTDQYGNPIVFKDTNQPLPERVDFEFVSIFGENNGV